MTTEVTQTVESTEVVPDGSQEVVSEEEVQIGIEIEPVVEPDASTESAPSLVKINERLRRIEQSNKDLRYENGKLRRGSTVDAKPAVPTKSQIMREEGYESHVVEQQEAIENLQRERDAQRNRAFIALTDSFIGENKIPEGSELALAFVSELDDQLADYDINIRDLAEMLRANSAVVPDKLLETMPKKLKTALRIATASVAEKKNAVKATKTVESRTEKAMPPSKGAAPASGTDSWEGLSYHETKARIEAGAF